MIKQYTENLFEYFSFFSCGSKSMLMLKPFLTFTIILVFVSCAPRTIELTNGNMITEKKETRMIHRAMRKAYRNLSKEDRHLFDRVTITVDTSTQNKR